MIQPLTEQEQDIAQAQGFLQEWLRNDLPQVKDNLKIVIDGIAHYRSKHIEVQQDYSKLLENYNQLTAQSALYLQHISQQKEQIDGLLIETQREFHHENSVEQQ